VPEIDQQFVDRMEDVLSLYARPHSKAEPVLCLDERPIQLLDPARPGLPIQPGKPPRTDYEYVREGTANIFWIVEPITGSRLTYASANRNGRSFARALWRIVRRYRHVRRIHLVLDNLSTHSEKCVVQALGARDRRQLLLPSSDNYSCRCRPWWWKPSAATAGRLRAPGRSVARA
jgi:hypothetical protein